MFLSNSNFVESERSCWSLTCRMCLSVRASSLPTRTSCSARDQGQSLAKFQHVFVRASWSAPGHQDACEPKAGDSRETLLTIERVTDPWRISPKLCNTLAIEKPCNFNRG